MKRIVALALTLLAPGIFVIASSQPASASPTCYKHDNNVTDCIVVSLIERRRVIVESVPLENNSSKTVTMHCSFSRAITKEESTTAEVSSSIEMEIPMTAKATIGGSFSRTKTQTATQATEAGGEVTLKPGQSVTCNRTYGFARFKVHSWQNFGTDRYHNNNYYRAKVPSYLGVLITD